MIAKKRIILIIALLITASQSELCTAALKHKAKLLQEGFVVAGLDGEMAKVGDNGEWFVKLDKTIADDKGQIRAGQLIQLLPASSLEKIIADAKKDSPSGIRLWGRVTRYGNKNFIFPTYYLPLTEAQPERATPSTPAEPNINEPGDTIILPDEVLQKLRPKRLIRLAQLRMGLESEEDTILVERAGFIIKPENSPYYIFQLDALGRNTDDVSFHLLPCEALERAIITQAGGVIRAHYKITGIITKYKGQHYLLPQRATRIFSHGNFAG